LIVVNEGAQVIDCSILWNRPVGVGRQEFNVAHLARQYGLRGLNAALEGVKGTTAIHICFGYAAIIHLRPSGYSFLPELVASPVNQISIETAQSKLDCSVLQKLPGKTIILGTLDLSDMATESPETVAARIRRALPYVSADRIVVAPDVRQELKAR
jgi:5-methyltetrahydropteroyltriglutamate--homocysteine methyltransferase